MYFPVQLLGLRGRDSYLDPQILAAYESLAAEPIEEGFSQRASDGRMLLLEEVFQVEMHLYAVSRHKQKHYTALLLPGVKAVFMMLSVTRITSESWMSRI